MREGAVHEFEKLLAPHLDAACNLARWLTRNPDDADDVVQEAYLRAFRFFDGFRGGDARAWLLTIVRNTFYTWVQQQRGHETLEYSEESASLDCVDAAETPLHNADPQHLLLRAADRARVEAALRRLPVEYREVLVLRELEELSYKQVASIAGIPIGTVMSRLSRARERLRAELEADPT